MLLVKGDGAGPGGGGEGILAVAAMSGDDGGSGDGASCGDREGHCQCADVVSDMVGNELRSGPCLLIQLLTSEACS